MKRILILANNDIGLWNFRKEVVTAFISAGYEVCVSLPDGKRVNDIRNLGCEIDLYEIDRRGMNPLADLKLFSHYRNLIKRYQPDVVLGYTIKPNVYGGMAASFAGIPFIANVTGLGSAVETPGILQKLTVGLYRFALHKAACIFFQNQGNEHFFTTHNIVGAPHRIIPGSGVNLEDFTPAPYIKEGVVKFLFISRLLKEKGIEEYFSAAEYFRSKRKDVEFHILGFCEDDYSSRLKELQDQGIVIYHGLQYNVRPFIAESACLIHPTYYPEGMSNVILEASAVGRPIIATRRYGCKEAVEEDVTGFLFEEKDREGLFESIEKFLSLSPSAREEMGKSARRKMEKEFDRNIVIKAYLDEIDKALNTTTNK